MIQFSTKQFHEKREERGRKTKRDEKRNGRNCSSAMREREGGGGGAWGRDKLMGSRERGEGKGWGRGRGGKRHTRQDTSHTKQNIK